MAMDEAWFEAMGREACEWAWDAMEQDLVPVRDFTAPEVRAQLATMAAYGYASAVIGEEHAAAFSRGYWRRHRDLEDDRSEGAYERQCEAHYGGDGPAPVEQVLRDAARLK